MYTNGTIHLMHLLYKHELACPKILLHIHRRALLQTRAFSHKCLLTLPTHPPTNTKVMLIWTLRPTRHGTASVCGEQTTTLSTFGWENRVNTASMSRSRTNSKMMWLSLDGTFTTVRCCRFVGDGATRLHGARVRRRVSVA